MCLSLKCGAALARPKCGSAGLRASGLAQSCYLNEAAPPELVIYPVWFGGKASEKRVLVGKP